MRSKQNENSNAASKNILSICEISFHVEHMEDMYMLKMKLNWSEVDASRLFQLTFRQVLI